MIITITGPSGSGKSTLEQLLHKNRLAVPAVSCTSRPPRPGEVDGVNYYFKTKEEMNRMLEAGELVEHTEHSGNIYGVAKSELLKGCMPPYAVTLVCDPHGVEQIRSYAAAQYLQHISVFCATPLSICRARVAKERPDRLEFLTQVEAKWQYADESRSLYDEVVPLVDTSSSVFGKWFADFGARLDPGGESAKYVEFDSGDWIIFSEAFNHIDLCDAAKMALIRSSAHLSKVTPVSAGFVDYSVRRTHGRSESMGMKSDQGAALRLRYAKGSS